VKNGPADAGLLQAWLWRHRGRNNRTINKSQNGYISCIWGQARTIPVKSKIYMEVISPHVITCAKFRNENACHKVFWRKCQFHSPDGSTRHIGLRRTYKLCDKRRHIYKISSLPITRAYKKTKYKLENVAIANALQLEGRSTSRHSFLAVFGQFCILRIRRPTNCYFRTYQNSDIANRFNSPDFLKMRSNLAIRRRFHAVTLTFDPLTLNVCCRSGVT